MKPFVSRAPARRRIVFALGALLALVPASWLWGFTVDDALIPARYATHVARGLGYRFNANGPVSDGVTPLGWVYFLAPFAAEGALRAHTAAKILGALAWTTGAGALAVAIDEVSDRPARWAALALVPASAPLAAWSVAGMETGVVIGACAWATALAAWGRMRASALLCAWVAAWRPEATPFALVLASLPDHGAPPGVAPAAAARLGSAGVHCGRWRAWRGRVARGVAVAGAVVLVALVRVAVFGRAAPLSIYAKAPDAVLGARYALACFLLGGPVALVAPLVWTRIDPFARGLLVAVGVHFASIAVAGGDWMPLSRLAAPALPCAMLAAAHVASFASWPATAVRFALAIAGQVFVMVHVGPAASRVSVERSHVRDELAAFVASAKVVAALDVGWVGAVTDATIVDLGGVTDPAIAALPSGHTTRRIPASLLHARRVDTLVLLLDGDASVPAAWHEARFARGVERRVAALAGDDFEVVGGSSGGLRYLVARRVRVRSALIGWPGP